MGDAPGGGAFGRHCAYAAAASRPSAGTSCRTSAPDRAPPLPPTSFRQAQTEQLTQQETLAAAEAAGAASATATRLEERVVANAVKLADVASRVEGLDVRVQVLSGSLRELSRSLPPGGNPRGEGGYQRSNSAPLGTPGRPRAPPEVRLAPWGSGIILGLELHDTVTPPACPAPRAARC